MTSIEIFEGHQRRLALYAKLRHNVNDTTKLFEMLVVKPTRKLEWALRTQIIAATAKGE